MGKPTVAVLMSTYNGEKYLKEQIDSILLQKDVDLHLFVRDDGSTDGTKSIIEEYCNKNNNVTFIRSDDNLGPGKSFITLLKEVCLNYNFEYFAFADQDDVWLERKIVDGIDRILRSDYVGPVLYCSNQYLYVNGNNIGLRHKEKQSIDLISHMQKNTIAGCTFVFNDKLADLIANRDFPEKRILEYRIHDAWLMLIAIVCGIVIYDETANMLYRIHSNNVVGIREITIKDRWYRFLRFFDKSKSNLRLITARELLRLYPEMDKKSHDILDLYANYNENLRCKKKLLKNQEIINNCGENSFVFSIKAILGLI